MLIVRTKGGYFGPPYQIPIWGISFQKTHTTTKAQQKLQKIFCNVGGMFPKNAQKCAHKKEPYSELRSPLRKWTKITTEKEHPDILDTLKKNSPLTEAAPVLTLQIHYRGLLLKCQQMNLLYRKFKPGILGK